MCDGWTALKAQGKVYNAALRPAVIYSPQTVAQSQSQMAELQVAGLKMLQCLLGWTDRIRNKQIRANAKVRRRGYRVMVEMMCR